MQSKFQLKMYLVYHAQNCLFLSTFKTIVSSRVGTPPFSEGTPPFWVPPSFWSKLKKLPPSFWQPSKLVHVNCKKHFKIKVLRFILYYINGEYHKQYSYFQAQLCIYYWHFLWLDIAFNVFYFDMQEEWKWNISNSHIIKSNVYII